MYRIVGGRYQPAEIMQAVDEFAHVTAEKDTRIADLERKLKGCTGEGCEHCAALTAAQPENRDSGRLTDVADKARTPEVL
jgi:hypothetical protein